MGSQGRDAAFQPDQVPGVDENVSTPGARHLAESEQWLAAQKEAPAPTCKERLQVQPATALLVEVAAAHDGQPPADWLRVMKWRLYGQD